MIILGHLGKSSECIEHVDKRFNLSTDHKINIFCLRDLGTIYQFIQLPYAYIMYVLVLVKRYRYENSSTSSESVTQV